MVITDDYINAFAVGICNFLYGFYATIKRDYQPTPLCRSVAKTHLMEKFDHVEVIAKEKSYWIIECKKEADA